MATTTNYSWTTPDDTALVKDGAAAIRSLGTAIDSTVFTNAGAAIAKTIVDAKGDIIAATAADTVSRLAVGANDTVLTADSSTATGLKWAAPAAGGMTLLSTTTLSGASTTITTDFTNYLVAYISFENVDLSANDTVLIRPNNSSTGVFMALIAQDGASAVTGVENNQEIQFNVTTNLSATQTINNALLQINNPASTSTWKSLNYSSVWESTGGKSSYFGGGGIATTSAITSIVCVPNTGGTTFQGGTVKIYGVK